MLKNDHQLKAAQKKRDDLKEALNTSESGTDTEVLDVLMSEAQAEIDEYCGIRDGHIRSFEVDDLSGIGEILIKARIARGLSQKELAVRLGVSEQSVQRDEAGGYERAGLARVADCIDALGYRFKGCASPTEDIDPPWGWLAQAGGSAVAGSNVFRFGDVSQAIDFGLGNSLIAHMKFGETPSFGPRISRRASA